MRNPSISRIQILRACCFFLLIIIIDQTSGRIFKYLYFNQKAGQGANLNYIFAECKADVLIFGNSRAQHHYDTKIISDSLKMSCYNAGIDGGFSILLSCAQLQIILSRYTPKIVIVEFDPSFLMEFRPDEYERYNILLPYYDIYPQLHPLIEKRSKLEKYKLLSRIYPYNSNLIWLLRFNTNIDFDRNWIYNGYIPIRNRQINYNIANIQTEKSTFHKAAPEKLAALEKIIQLCKCNNIKLFLINSPVYNTGLSKQSDLTWSNIQVNEILDREHIKLIDFAKDKYFVGEKTFFADNLHLNEKGATKYSQMIGQLVSKSIQYTSK